MDWFTRSGKFVKANTVSAPDGHKWTKTFFECGCVTMSRVEAYRNDGQPTFYYDSMCEHHTQLRDKQGGTPVI